MRLLQVECCDSTQDLARQHLLDFDAVLTSRQTAGRGRAGRSWLCAQNALAISVILKVNFALNRVTLLPLAAGVAVAKCALELGAPLELKWPNDLVRYVDRKNPAAGFSKLGGILCEAHAISGANGDSGLAVIVGIGLNLGHAPADLPEASGLELSTKPKDFAELLWPHLQNAVNEVEHSPQNVIASWLSLAPPLGTELKRGSLVGRFAGIALSGALLLDTPEGKVEISAGDVDFATKLTT